MNRPVEPDSFELSFTPLVRRVMTLVLAGPRHCRVSVEPSVLRVTMGVAGWAFRAEVARASITRVEPVSGRVWSWGAHGFRGRWLVNGSSRGLVAVTIEPTGTARCLGVQIRLGELTLSLDDPSGFIDALRTG